MGIPKSFLITPPARLRPPPLCLCAGFVGVCNEEHPPPPPPPAPTPLDRPSTLLCLLWGFDDEDIPGLAVAVVGVGRVEQRRFQFGAKIVKLCRQFYLGILHRAQRQRRRNANSITELAQCNCKSKTNNNGKSDILGRRGREQTTFPATRAMKGN